MSGSASEPDVVWLRLSPRSLIVRPTMDLLRLLPFLLGLLYLRSRGGSANYWGVGFALLAVVASIVRWLTTRYRITDERVYVRRGLLSQKVLSVSRDRVRTVDLSAHVLYRMLGLRRVSIGTGRNDRRDGESFRLDALTLADAEALRALLLAAPVVRFATSTAGGEPAAVDAAGIGPAGVRHARVRPAQLGPAGVWPEASAHFDAAAAVAGDTEIARLHPAWIRFAPLTLTGMVIIGVIFGFIVQFNDAAHIDVAAIGPVHSLGVEYAGVPLGLRILGGVLAVVFCIAVISTAGYVAVFWNFRLVRLGDGSLRQTRGLLSTRSTTIDARRLRGVEISEPLLLRAAGGARCIAITTGLRVGRGAERGGSLLLPPAPRSVARGVAADVMGITEELCTGALVRHGPRARRRRYLRALASSALIIGVAAVVCWAASGPAWIWLGSLVLLPLGAALAADRYRNLGHRLTEGRLVTCTGSLVRRRSILATEGIIGWRLHQSWFQRRQGLVTLTATSAAGRQHYAARDMPAAEALAVATAATGQLVRPFLAAGQDG